MPFCVQQKSMAQPHCGTNVAHASFAVSSVWWHGSPNARHTVSVDDVRWADVILVMGEKHKSRLVAEFTRLLDGKPVHVLDIADDYKYMDRELIEQLEQSVTALLALE